MKISDKLAIATCALLQPVIASAETENDRWDISSEALFYSESDGRVQIFEPIANAAIDLDNDEKLNLKVVIDVMTGATPNGAHASSNAQTFTTPSGDSSYTTSPGSIPIDDTFHDTRVALSADWEMPVFDEHSSVIWGASFSNEYDYLSLGGSATLLRNFNGNNTTLSLGLGFANDTITPQGNIPDPLTPMRAANAGTNRIGADDTKTTTDLLLGLTQVINRRTVMQFNYTISNVDGYQNDPFKIVPLVDPVTGLPSTGSASLGTDDLPYLYENRPDTRSRNALFWKTVYSPGEDVLRFSYRHYWDDWGIDSDTFDLRYRYKLSEQNYLQPHLRFYSQTAADYYVHSLSDGVALPQYATSDYRMGEFDSITLGLKWGHVLSRDNEISTRLEFMQQDSKVVGTPIGDQNSNDIAPDLDALMLSVGYSFKW